MLGRIDGHYLLLLGFENVKTRDPEKMLEKLRSSFPDFQIQILKADLIAGSEHLFFAARNALQSFKSGRARSKSLAVELLLYASCQHQISRAIDLVGIGREDQRIAVAAISHSKERLAKSAEQIESQVQGKNDDSVLQIDNKKAASLKKVYHITPLALTAAKLPGEKEIEVLKRLVIEKSALLALGS